MHQPAALFCVAAGCVVVTALSVMAGGTPSAAAAPSLRWRHRRALLWGSLNPILDDNPWSLGELPPEHPWHQSLAPAQPVPLPPPPPPASIIGPVWKVESPFANGRAGTYAWR